MSRQLRKIRWICLVVLMSSIFFSRFVGAQQYPTKPIVTVIPMSAGGSSDLLMRCVVGVANNYLEQRIILEIKAGGSGAIGTDYVVKAAPDGYTLLAGGPAWISVLPAIEGRIGGPNDLDGICQINYDSPFAFVRSDSPFKTLEDVIQHAKANPGKLVYGNTGPWGATDIVWKKVKRQTGIETRDVPHRGGMEPILGVLGGQLDFTISGYASAVSFVEAKKLRVIAYFGPERSVDLPDVPTAKEKGINVVFEFRRSVLAPKGTPRPIISKLAGVFKKITEDPSFIAMIKKIGQEVHYLGTEDFIKAWREEYEEYKELGKIFKK